MKEKNIDELTKKLQIEFRDYDLSYALAKCMLYPKGSVKEGVPTRKENEAYYRKLNKKNSNFFKS